MCYFNGNMRTVRIHFNRNIRWKLLSGQPFDTCAFTTILDETSFPSNHLIHVQKQASLSNPYCEVVKEQNSRFLRYPPVIGFAQEKCQVVKEQDPRILQYPLAIGFALEKCQLVKRTGFKVTAISTSHWICARED